MSQDSPIEIRRIKEVDIKGGTVLDGFPSAGLANASFLLQERLYSRLKKRTRRSWILLYMPLEAQKRLQEDFKMPESNSFPMDLSLEFRRYY